ncbi:Periplasmic divalent cation tolerance protein CutA [invertebrate metagenome]|uniref:Periplasmic divalent cation tolerance protein CutA n=1 Tax=invertebrate metagenome TaxID=1711999 RepID=A0A484H744_9ZZZZ
MDYRLVYVTTTSYEEAFKIGRAVVEARLAACANLLGAVKSVYWWQGSLEEDDEVALLLKTSAACVEQVVAKVQALHSHTCPCVVAVPIATGSPAFLEWITQETRDS